MFRKKPTVLPPLLNQYLKKTARSFYLSLAFLPQDFKKPIGLAYVLARLADDICDAKKIEQNTKTSFLEFFRQTITSKNIFDAKNQFEVKNQLQKIQTNPSLKNSVKIWETSLSFLQTLSQNQQQNITWLLDQLTLAMQWDLNFFDKNKLNCVQNEDQLDKYCYQIAGVVGMFWMQMLEPLLDNRGTHKNKIYEWASDYGKGLQLINILKDISFDFQRGRVYLPQTDLKKWGLATEDIQYVQNYDRFWPIIQKYLLKSLQYLKNGSQIFYFLPKHLHAIYGSTVMPALIGLKSLDFLNGDHQLLSAHFPHKIKRSSVYCTVFSLLVGFYSPEKIQKELELVQSKLKKYEK